MTHDAVVIGSGPNGLAAAATLAQAGRSVLVLEANERIGGGARTAELTLPGFRSDVCSAIHPLGVASPYLRSLPLELHGLRWMTPAVQLAHPLDDSPAALLYRSLTETAQQFGRRGQRYLRLIQPVVDDWSNVLDVAMRPVVRIPKHPLTLARLGVRSFPPASVVGRLLGNRRSAALFAGNAAHASSPLSQVLTSSAGLMLMAAGHVDGWPVAEGGSQSIVDALAAYVVSFGGEIRTGCTVHSLTELPPHRVALFDTGGPQLAAIAGDALPIRYRQRLLAFRNGPGAFKIDYALDGPMPWTDPGCATAGTVHLGGTMAEIAAAEAEVHTGKMPQQPFVLVAQQSVVDGSRAPAGKHTLWAYAHVPNGFDGDATAMIENQIERFAPGFRDLVLARHVITPAWLESYNANYRGGDIAAGSHSHLQLVFRPTRSLRPYATPNPAIWICSAASPPGAGVHGMCGHNAAAAVLRGPLA